ncbi:MAG: hypothetical protein WCO84_01270 [bacterium]
MSDLLYTIIFIIVMLISEVILFHIAKNYTFLDNFIHDQFPLCFVMVFFFSYCWVVVIPIGIIGVILYLIGKKLKERMEE